MSSASHRAPQPAIPTSNLVELDDEMRKIAGPSLGHYDTPRSNSVKAKSQSLSRVMQPVPKPRQRCLLFCGMEWNGTEHLIPQNTYLAEHIEMGPKQLPSLVVII